MNIFAKKLRHGGILKGYSNTNGTYLADRMTIDSIQFDVPIPDADLIMPKIPK